jgi:hypothetical protein
MQVHLLHVLDPVNFIASFTVFDIIKSDLMQTLLYFVY